MPVKLIDLSQEIYQGMPIFPMHQPTFIMTNMSHEENMEKTGSKTLGFSARNLLISEHAGTHTDGISEFKKGGPTVDAMPLESFWGSAICLDISHVPASRRVEVRDLKDAAVKAGLEIQQGDIVLLYTGHYKRNFNTPKWLTEYTGLSYEAAAYLAKAGAVNIGVDTPSIDHTDDINFQGHLACGDFGITNTENLCNLDLLAGRRFLYFGLPLKIRSGSGSPIRAVALVEE